jgi:hypothetical protein
MIQSFARSVSPVLVLGLTILWLVLNQSIAPGHIALGLLLGALVAWAGSTLRPLHARLRRFDVAGALLFVALSDVVRHLEHKRDAVLELMRRGDLTPAARESA